MFLNFILGVFIGSFYNVLILRILRKQKGIFFGKSECPHCKHLLGSFDLIPILSWILLRGKCRYCGTVISPQYALVELLTGIIWALTGLTSKNLEIIPLIVSYLLVNIIYLIILFPLVKKLYKI